MPPPPPSPNTLVPMQMKNANEAGDSGSHLEEEPLPSIGYLGCMLLQAHNASVVLQNAN